MSPSETTTSLNQSFRVSPVSDPAPTSSSEPWGRYLALKETLDQEFGGEVSIQVAETSDTDTVVANNGKPQDSTTEAKKRSQSADRRVRRRIRPTQPTILPRASLPRTPELLGAPVRWEASAVRRPSLGRFPFESTRLLLRLTSSPPLPPRRPACSSLPPSVAAYSVKYRPLP